jgi:hypothetical protein
MAKQQPILDLLAKELGYKDGTDLKKRLKESHGDDFAGSLKSRLEDGQGIGESLKGGFSDAKAGIKKAFSAKSIKQKLVQGAFGGDNVLSAFVRGKLKGKKLEANALSPTPVGGGEGAGGVGTEGPLLESIAKSSMVLPDMARDMHTMQLNVKELVKVKGGKPATGASSFFRKQREEEEKAENDRKKLGTKKQEPGVPKPADEGGGFLSGIFDMLKNGLFSAAKFIFNPKNLMKVIGKLALPLLIISTLFSGITAGFEKYQETGNLSDAIVAGLGGMLKFLTFGLFDENTIKDVFDSLTGVFQPVIDTISGIFDSIKGFFKNIFGDTIDVKDVSATGAKDVTPKMDTAAAADTIKKDVTSASEGGGAPSATPPSTSPTAVEKTETSKSPTPTGEELGKKAETSQSGAQDYLTKVIGIKQNDDGTYTDTNTQKTLSESEVKNRISATGQNPDKVLETLKGGQPKGTMQASGPAASSGVGGAAASASGGGGGGGGGGGESGGAASASAVSPSPTGEEPKSGESISSASTQVAEAQRMESAADQGSVINAPTNSNSTSSTGKPSKQTASVYDEDFVNRLVTT